MTVSINSQDFVENFEIGKMTVGIVGHGYIGRAIESFFSSECKTLVYDKYDDSLDTLEDVVRESHAIFVAVPTPMNKDGSCYTGIVESVFEDIKTVAKVIDRDTNEFVVVLKSTVYPGFTSKMIAKGGLRLVFSPEFLTEKNSIEDFENTNRILLGGPIDDARVVYKFFERKLGDRVCIAQCEPTAAEMTKLFTNAFLSTKVMFANEIYQICQKLNVKYDEVMTLACLDRRIAYSHFSVPGHDGDLGFGGHCFPKDVNSLRSVSRDLGVEEKLFTAVIERNNELRKNKDWLEMKGRAVVDGYEEETTEAGDRPGRDAVHTAKDRDVPSS